MDLEEHIIITHRYCYLKFLYLLHQLHRGRKYIYKRRRSMWIRPIFSNRRAQGDFYNLIQEMQLKDVTKYCNYLRMSPLQFDSLLSKVGPKITKIYRSREPISAAERLSITLRYLATGDSMASISYAFRVGITTVSQIINECCEAIWLSLKDEVLLLCDTSDWYKIASGFNDRWQMPNCLGAIDGKHVVIQAPPNSGSLYFNYKNNHSLNLMAVCSYEYKFVLVDFGAPGRQSDGGVFRNSEMGKMFYRKELNFPPDRAIEANGEKIPFYFIGDEAFPLSNNLMRPYPGHFLPQTKRVFNYRLSRARRVVEDSFGILASTWRILRKPIIASVDATEKIIIATICLHNLLINSKHIATEVTDLKSEPLQNLLPVQKMGTNNRTQAAAHVRDQLALYFMQNGAVDFQWNK